MANKTFEVTVKITVEDGVDINDLVNEAYYEVSWPGIVDTEIVSGPDNIKDQA